MNSINIKRIGGLEEGHKAEIAFGPAEIGQVYPVFGAVTKVVDETPGHVVVELNHSILAELSISDPAGVELIKQHAFEPAIFISEIKSISPQIVLDCKTIVFGKTQTYHA